MKNLKTQIIQFLIQVLVLILVWIAKVIFGLSKITKSGSGTSLPGFLVEKYFPWILTNLSQDFVQIILITGTNGKTTTRAILVHIFEENGEIVCTNRGGANIMRGIAASLLLNKNWKAQSKAKIAILEIEEATLPILTRFVLPNFLILTNIFRDQLDAYGEIDQTLSYFNNSIGQIIKNSQKISDFRKNLDQNLKLSENQGLSEGEISKIPKQEKIKSDNSQNYIDRNSFENKVKIDQNNSKLVKNLQKLIKIIPFFNSKKSTPNFNSQKNQKDNEIKTKISDLEDPDLKNLENSSSGFKKKQFQGFFGRQFPKENIYEDDFDNSKENFEESFNNSDPEKKLILKNSVALESLLLNKKNNSTFDLSENLKISKNNQNLTHNSLILAKSSNDNLNIEKQKNLSKNPVKIINSVVNLSNIEKITKITLNDKQKKSEKKILKNLFLPQIIVNKDDVKLLTCLQNCTLPIIGFELATDAGNLPKFEEVEKIFKPVFETIITAKSLVARGGLSHFELNFDQKNEIKNETVKKITIETQLPGFFNLYNILAIIPVVYPIFGNKIVDSIASFGPVFGRGEIIKIKNNQIKIFLVKNPAGFEQVLELIHAENLENKNNSTKIKSQNETNLAFLINDKIADGRDLSWLWDVDFENFLTNTKVDQILTGGIRGPDMLLRLEMSNWLVKIEDNKNNSEELIETILNSQKDWIICATYTAMLEIRTKLGKHTKLKEIDSSGY